MRLISWNVRGPSAARILLQVRALRARRPDLVALQEVTAPGAPHFREQLAGAGLPFFSDSFGMAPKPGLLKGPRRYGQLLASRWPLRTLAPIDLPWPERLLSAVVTTPAGAMELHTTHIPPGASHGWLKIRMLEGIYRHLACRAAIPRILCGDFNTPEEELPDGTVQTWGFPGERWDLGERNVLLGLAGFDLADAFRRLHGYRRRAASWYTTQGKVGRRYDHVLASGRLHATACDYLHAVRTRGLSDHSAIEVVFRPRRR